MDEETKESRDWRSISAYGLMGTFVFATSVGLFMINPAFGFIGLGVTSGIYGKILGDS